VVQGAARRHPADAERMREVASEIEAGIRQAASRTPERRAA